MTKGRWLIQVLAVFLAIILLGVSAPALAGKTTPSLNATPTPTADSISMAVSVIAEEINVSMPAGYLKGIPITIKNNGNAHDVYDITLTGADWASLNSTRIALYHGNEKKINLMLEPDENANGIYTLKVKATSVKDLAVEDSETIKVNVLAQNPTGSGVLTGFITLTSGAKGAVIAGILLFGILIFIGYTAKSTALPKLQIFSRKEKDTGKIENDDKIIKEWIRQLDSGKPMDEAKQLVKFEKQEGKYIWEA